ncbi:MAG TPA: HAMP domain-containing protein [Gaiellaceae bacterium]|nr:HAMP domain-containing protein [Gaiellaceae bacterium]
MASIRRRYVAFAVLLSVLIAAACGLFVYAAVLGSHTTRSWRLSTRTIARVDALNRDLVTFDTAVHAAIAADSPDPIAAVLPRLGGENGLAESILASADTPGQRAVAARLRKERAALVAGWITPGVADWRPSSATVKRDRNALVDRQTAAGQASLLAFARAKEREAVRIEQAAARLRNDLLAGGAILVALALALMLLAAVEVRRLVVRPALALQHAASRVSHGDLDTALVPAGPKELATVAAEFDRMRAALKVERGREEERTQARLELAAAKQEAARLDSLNIVAAGVAHEFNNHFQAIIGQTELLRQTVAEAARAGLDDIESAAWQAAQLARKMLVASGHGHYVWGPVAAAEVASSLREFELPGLRFSVEPGPPGATLVGDEPHVRQALGAAVTNACESYAGGVGEVTVVVELRILDEE